MAVTSALTYDLGSTVAESTSIQQIDERNTNVNGLLLVISIYYIRLLHDTWLCNILGVLVCTRITCSFMTHPERPIAPLSAQFTQCLREIHRAEMCSG